MQRMATPWPVLPSAVPSTTAGSYSSAEAEDAYLHYVRQWVEAGTDNAAVRQLRAALLAQDDETKGGDAAPITALLPGTSTAPEQSKAGARPLAVVGAAAEWQGGLHNAVQWLSAGLSHLAQPGFTLCSTSRVREALRAVLHCAPGPSFVSGMSSEACTHSSTNDDTGGAAEGDDEDDRLLRILQRCVPVHTNDDRAPIGTLVLLLFHRHRALRLWARLSLLHCVAELAHATDTDKTRTAQALWRFAIELLCVLKHIQGVSLCTLGSHATSTTLEATVCQLVGDALYSLFVLLTTLDEALTRAAAQEPGKMLVHPVTALLLGGTILLRWGMQAVPAALTTSFLSTAQRSVLAASPPASGYSKYNHTSSSSSHERNNACNSLRHERDGLRRIMQALDSALGAQPGRTHIAPSLNTATAKSLVKVLVHLLLDHAKAVFAEPVTQASTLAHMRLLWYCASLLRPPSARLQVPSLTTAQEMRWITPPAQCAGWMLRALLRNAESQLRLPAALQVAKARPGTSDEERGEHECDVLVAALLALHALFSSLLSELPGLLLTRFMHELLGEQEQTIVAIAIGGVLRAHRHEGLDLLRLLMRADLSAFYASRLTARAGTGVSEDAAARTAQPSRCLSRVWGNYAAMWRHALSPRCAAEPALLLAIAEVLVVLTEQPVWAEWLLLSADIAHAGPDALRGQVAGFIEHVVCDILEGCAADMTALLRGSKGQPYTGSDSSCSNARSRPGVFSAEQLLATGTPLPRFAQLLLFAQDVRLRRMGQALQRILLADLRSVVCEIYTTDTAQWIWQRVILAQPALTNNGGGGGGDGDHFLALQDTTIDGLARAQGEVWLRVLAACPWHKMSGPRPVMGMWWACALLVDNLALDAAAQQELIEKVIVQLPSFDALCGRGGEGAGQRDEYTYEGSKYEEDEDEDDEDGNARSEGEEEANNEDGRRKDWSEDKLYAVMGHLLLCLLAKQRSYGPAMLTRAVCHIVQALPSGPRGASEDKLHTQFARGLVQLWPRLAPAEQHALRECGVDWAMAAARQATQTIDDCIAAQERCFQQYEWEEKALQEAQREEARGAQAARALREHNVRERTKEIAAERHNNSNNNSSSSNSKNASSLSRSGASLSFSAPHISTSSHSSSGISHNVTKASNNDNNDDGANNAQDITTTTTVTTAGNVNGSKTPRRLPPALLIAQERRMELYAVVERTRQGHLMSNNNASNVPPPAPTALQRKLQALQERQARLQRHIRNEQELQEALRRMAVSTDLLRHPPYIGDIIGGDKLCLAKEIPVLPEIYTVEEGAGIVDVDSHCISGSSSNGGSDGAQAGTYDVATIYANSFAPHVALELRFGIYHAFQDVLEQCRMCAVPSAALAPPPPYSPSSLLPPPSYTSTTVSSSVGNNGKGMTIAACLTSTAAIQNDSAVAQPTSAASKLATLTAALTRRFPLNPYIAREALAVTHHGRSPSDPLHPTRLSFAVSPTCTTEGMAQSDDGSSDDGGGEHAGHNKHKKKKKKNNKQNNQQAMGTRAAVRQLNNELSEGDVVLVLLPLATLLPAWVRHQSEDTTSEEDIESRAEALVRQLPAAWRTLGCLPQLCHVQNMQALNLRGAVLSAYSTTTVTQPPQQQHAGKRAREEGGQYTNGSANGEPSPLPPIRFSHALHVGFEAGTGAPFYLIRIASVSAAVTAIHALHDIHSTRFAATIYNPRQTAGESAQYHRSFMHYFAQRGVLAAARARLLLAHCLNDWQVRAIASVLYAVQPNWLPANTTPDTTTTSSSSTNIAGKSSDNGVCVVKSEAAATYMHPTMERFFYPQRTPAETPDIVATTTSTASAGGAPGSSAAGGGGAAASSMSSTVLFMRSRVPDLLIIEGPPGTGKTQTIAALCHNLLHHLPTGSRVLLCAPSNCAVDEALLRTVHLLPQLRRSAAHPAGPNETVKAVRTADMVRVGVRRSVATDVLGLSPCVYLEDKLEQMVRSGVKGSSTSNNRSGRAVAGQQAGGGRGVLRQQILSEATLVFSTLGSLHQLRKLDLCFDVVILDEASQGTEPDVLLALLLARRQCILVGDSRQLQPTVLCEAAARRGLQRSLLTRLLHNGHRSFLLRTQYRMHPDICAFPNAYFYHGQLHTAAAVLQREGLDKEGGQELQQQQRGTAGQANKKDRYSYAQVMRPLSRGCTLAQRLYGLPRFGFVNVATGVMRRGRGHSWQNHAEAGAVVQYMRQLRTHLQLSIEDFAEHCGIISYYRAQRDALMQALTPRERRSGLQIATVDSFQGKEKDIILISCVRALSDNALQRFHADNTNNNNDDDEVRQEEKEVLLSDDDEEDEEEEEAGGGYDESVDSAERGDRKHRRYEDPHRTDARRTQDPRRPSSRHTLGFLSDWHRINVSLTRAREMCLVFGHAPTLQAAAQASQHRNRRNEEEGRDEAAAQYDPRMQYKATQVGDSAEAVRRELRQAAEDPLALPCMLEHIQHCMTGNAEAPAQTTTTQTRQPSAKQQANTPVVVDVLTSQEEEEQQGGEARANTAATAAAGDEEDESVCIVEGNGGSSNSSSGYKPQAVYIEYYAHNRLMDELQRSAAVQRASGM